MYSQTNSIILIYPFFNFVDFNENKGAVLSGFECVNILIWVLYLIIIEPLTKLVGIIN